MAHRGWALSPQGDGDSLLSSLELLEGHYRVSSVPGNEGTDEGWTYRHRDKDRRMYVVYVGKNRINISHEPSDEGRWLTTGYYITSVTIR